MYVLQTLYAESGEVLLGHLKAGGTADVVDPSRSAVMHFGTFCVIGESD